MSLDSLFQQILLTEQQLTEQTQKFKEVKVAIIKCNEKIKAITEKYEYANQELDDKAQQLCAMKLQFNLMKRSEEQMSRQIEELLRQKDHLRERLASVKKQSAEEQEKFLQEISKFNTDLSLRGNRETAFQSQTYAEIQDLQREEGALHKEMELMSQKNRHLSSVEEEEKALLLELRGLDGIIRDLDWQLSEAEAATATLRAESVSVSQKPLADSTCLRLRKELEMHKNGELELLREALSSEIHFLQTKLANVQKSEQQ